MKQLNDFEVQECVGHFYEKDGMWFWHCMTCNTGSGKRHKHINGHKRDGDAAVALKYHRNAKRIGRQEKLYRAWWWREVMTTADPDHFAKLWLTHHWSSEIGEHDIGDVMAKVQSDNYLWGHMVKLSKEGDK